MKNPVFPAPTTRVFIALSAPPSRPTLILERQSKNGQQLDFRVILSIQNDDATAPCETIIVRRRREKTTLVK